MKDSNFRSWTDGFKRKTVFWDSERGKLSTEPVEHKKVLLEAKERRLKEINAILESETSSSIPRLS